MQKLTSNSDNTRQWMPPSVYMDDTERASHATGGYRSKTAIFDLCTKDLPIKQHERASRSEMRVVLSSDIHALFRGFQQGVRAEFVLKSSLTQLGINCEVKDTNIALDPTLCKAQVSTVLRAHSPLGVLALDYVVTGACIGKLFAVDKRRVVKTIDELQAMKDTRDMYGKPILVCGDGPTDSWKLTESGGRVIALLPVQQGVVRYNAEIHGMLPTIGLSLKAAKNYKELIRLHQEVFADRSRLTMPNDVLMVRTCALQVRALFGRVVQEMLPKGVRCASSNIIEPHMNDMDAAEVFQGRTFVFVSDPETPQTEELTHIPVEFYTLEAYREHAVFDHAQSRLKQRAQNPEDVSRAFQSMPANDLQACVFVCKAAMFDELNADDWVSSSPNKHPAHQLLVDSEERLKQVSTYLTQQCEYSVLSAISVGDITSDGVLLTRYFPSPVLKTLLMSPQVARHVKAIYFVRASRTYGMFFSQEDKAMMIDLQGYGIQTFQVDIQKKEMFQFLRRPGFDSGMMLPIARRHEYITATFFGVYGSNLVSGNFEEELSSLMQRIIDLRQTCQHPYLNKDKPLALVTGGGPGAMEVGNRVAKNKGILSCGMFVDFGAMAKKPGATINEQKQNPYVEAFMPYRPEKLVERQSDFHLDFPIFLMGGIGTDFEYALEEVRRKVGVMAIHPMVLFGTKEHFANKISARFQENKRCGVIKGSEWLSNVPYVVKNAIEAYAVYKRFFSGTLPIGPNHPVNDDGFIVVDEAFVAEAKL